MQKNFWVLSIYFSRVSLIIKKAPLLLFMRETFLIFNFYLFLPLVRPPDFLGPLFLGVECREELPDFFPEKFLDSD